MNIQYYKPKQDSLILFAKRRPKSRTRVIAGAMALVVIASFSYFKTNKHPLKTEAPISKNISSEQVPLSTSITAPTAPIISETKKPEAKQNDNANRLETIQKNDKDVDDEIDAANKSEKTSSSTTAVATKSEKSDGRNPLTKNTKTVTIKSHDTLGKIFARNAVSAKDIDAIVKSGDDAGALKKLQQGKKMTLLVDNSNRLQELSYPINSTDTLIISRNGSKFKSILKTKPLETKQAVAKFTIHGSVIASSKKAGLSNKQIAQLATIFKPNTDLNKGNHSGDKLSVIFQDYYLDGKKVRDGEIIAAEFMTATNTYQAIRYTEPNGHSGYYSPDGSSLDKRFLIAPVKFTRITSLFNPKRWHPILHRFRHHKGVDYAAPYGTPIKSVGNGTIALLGRKGGYGNTIIIKHDGSYSTLYGHMQKYASGLKKGCSVKQGQIIGYVGSSGLATGPHLHFEFRVNGVHRNPLTVALPNGKSITKAYRNKFKAEAKKLLAKLSAHKETRLAANKSDKDNNL